MFATLACGQSGLRVEIGDERSPGKLAAIANDSVRSFAHAAARLTATARERRLQRTPRLAQVPFSLPKVLRLVSGGRPLASPGFITRGSGSAITLTFDAAFPSGYEALLQDVFLTAEPTLNAVFGPPSSSANVFVRDFDADIGDRNAVAGGYFIPDNGSGHPEIRFPVYQSAEAAAVNFVHCLLLAYLGADQYAWDAFQEGLVRAGVMQVARTPGALPSTLDSSQVDAVLEATYDVGPSYDWFNQRALGGPVFIAPNLVSEPLPAGGSLGGLYLLRHQMSGSAWQKVLVQYPGFLSAYNAALYSNSSLGSDLAGLITLGQTVIDSLGGPSSTVEGLSFAEWFRRQFILETRQTFGVKLLLEPVAISSGLVSPDFGVFLVQANLFSTALDGSEALMSGASFPIFWDNSFNRLFPSVQENRMDLAGGYGSLTPNFPDLFGGVPYRVSVDVPVTDQIARVYLPAGGVATPSSTSPNDLYGTVVGAPTITPDTLRLVVSFGSTTLPPIPVVNGAFGALVGTSGFLGARSLSLSLIRTTGGVDSTVFTRTVNKGPGPIALDLRAGGEDAFGFGPGLPAGLSVIGMPLDPFESGGPSVFDIAGGSLMLARYNQSRAAYDFYPAVEAPSVGHAYFIRPDAANPSFAVQGRATAAIPAAVALRPGWNMIAAPLEADVPTSRVSVVRAANVPESYDAAVANGDIGVDFFEFVPGADDAASRVPETGTMAPAVQFEAGKGYFVRVIAPDGVTLVFAPASPSGGPFAPSRSFGQSSSAYASAALSGWLAQITLRGDGRSASALFGKSPTATRGFDLAQDSELPPGVGGLQAAFTGGGRLFRDVRRLGSGEVYRLTLEGLRKGQTYWLSRAMVRGRLGPVSVVDLTTREATPWKPGMSLRFVANAASRAFEIRSQAGDL
ncbi:MAG: hypothetical protein HYR64_00440 [Fimbriimonas ginsengisoli]|uniref:Uncharacterized protein n=1 Tax=Fimbriimonas ginsengisoli TaxID=1005039 RepID=A0A931LSW2_FIMGI|nr:hypothetical protein [Fimbriimonas ginsengisoli]